MKAKNVIQIVLAAAILVLIGYGLATMKKDKGSTNNTSVSNNNSNTPVAVEVKVDPVSADDHILGDKNAPVTLIEYSDYQCPYCVKHYPTMKQLMKEYDGKVRWAFRHYPLPFHQAAKKAAEAAEAAGAQGKFWEYSDKLIANSQPDGTGLGEADLIKYAQDLGLNMDQFKGDLSSGKYAAKVEKDLASGEKVGVTGTPATFLIDKNGKTELISGAAPLSQFKSKIDEALK